jgi:hypothetical protein
MLQKITAALVFGSVVGWLLVVLWWMLLLRQVRLEENALAQAVRRRVRSLREANGEAGAGHLR